MKKVLMVIGMMTFLLVGAVTVESVVAGQLNNKVCDDPPKKDVKSKKSCCHSGEMSDCKTPCTDKTAVKSDNKSKEGTTATTTTTETATIKKETEKVDPDKK
jgi:hypothetical protein